MGNGVTDNFPKLYTYQKPALRRFFYFYRLNNLTLIANCRIFARVVAELQ